VFIRTALVPLLDRFAVVLVALASAALALSLFTPVDDSQARTQASTVAAPIARPRAPGVGANLASAASLDRDVNVGVFGDSFGDGIWWALDQRLDGNGIEVHRLSRPATGFTTYQNVNLLDDIRAKLDRQPLDIAIVSFGANDTQGIFLDGHGNTFMSEGWQRIVTERVTAVVALLRERGVQVYWVGLPKMREAAFDADMVRMNAFYAARMQALNVPYFETATLSADANGRYAPYLIDPRTRARVNARTNDGIHMTIPGYIIVMRPLTERIRRSVAQARVQAGQSAERQAPAATPSRARRESGSPS
jgi:uncharacterized protein